MKSKYICYGKGYGNQIENCISCKHKKICKKKMKRLIKVSVDSDEVISLWLSKHKSMPKNIHKEYQLKGK